jgi:hypothetical protein
MNTENRSTSNEANVKRLQNAIIRGENLGKDYFVFTDETGKPLDDQWDAIEAIAGLPDIHPKFKDIKIPLVFITVPGTNNMTN